MTTPSFSSSSTSPTHDPADRDDPGRTTLTARSPEDLLAASAVVLGFWPTDSVVMLTFDAVHPFHARVDLPVDLDAMAELASTLVRPAAHHHVGRVVLLVYATHAPRARAAWRALRSELDRHDIVVAEALHVTPDRWHLLTDLTDPADLADPADPADDPDVVDDDGTDPRPDPVGVPIDLDRLAAHPFLAQAVVDGRVLHHTRAALAATLEPDVDATARVAAALRSLPDASPEAFVTAAAQLAEGDWAVAFVTRHVEAAPPGASGPEDAEVARLLRGMQTMRIRDAAWSAITRAHARSAVAFFGDIVRRSPPSVRAAPAALLAWAAWQAGDGALAWCALERCDAVDPDYGLAALVAEALERAVPPTVMAEGFDWREGLDGP